MFDLVHAMCRSSTLLGATAASAAGAAISRWGYAAVALGVFFEGETIVIAAGAMAHRGLLSLPGVVVAALAGSLLGDQLWFHMGHRYGQSFIARRPVWHRRAERAQALLNRFGTLFVISFRFIYGFRTITPVLLGVTGYPAVRYTILNATGAALWAVSFSIAGYALGASLMSLLGRATRLEEILLAAIGTGLLLWLVARVVNARTARRASRRASAEPSEPVPDGTVLRGR